MSETTANAITSKGETLMSHEKITDTFQRTTAVVSDFEPVNDQQDRDVVAMANTIAVRDQEIASLRQLVGRLDRQIRGSSVERSAGALQEICHGAAKYAGWWQHPGTGEPVQSNPYCFSNKLMLIVSEVSEAMEGDRKGLMDDKLPHREMREVELADAVIRIFDLAGAYDMDLGGAIQEKLAFNAQRPDHKLANRQAAGGKAY